MSQRDLSAMSRTCRELASEIVRRDSGPLYLPSEWRRIHTTNVRRPTCPDSFRALISYLASIRFFKGAGASHAHIKLAATIDHYPQRTTVFKISVKGGPMSVIRVAGGTHGVPAALTAVAPIAPKTARAIKDAAAAVHIEKLQQAKIHRKVPQEKRTTIAAKRAEVADLRRHVERAWKVIRAAPAPSSGTITRYMTETFERAASYSRRLYTAQQQLTALSAEIEELHEQLAEGDDVHKV